MKLLIVAVMYFGLFQVAGAQNMPPDLQKAMQCMQSIDQGKIEELVARGQQIKSEIKALCDKGDKTGAGAIAIKYAQSIKDDELLKQFNKCSEMMRKAMPNMPMPEMPKASSYEQRGFCDNL